MRWERAVERSGARRSTGSPHERRGPPRHAAGRVRLRATLDDWLDRASSVDVRLLGAGARHWPLLYPRTSASARMERRYTGFVDDRGAAPRALPRPHRRAASSTSPTAPAAPVPHRHHGQLKHRHRRAVEPRAEPPACGPTSRPLRGDEVRRRLVRVPGHRPLRHRLPRAAPARLDLRGEIRRVEAPWRAAHPDATFERVHRPAAAGLGRPRLHGDQPAHLRGRPDQDVPGAGRGRLRRRHRARRSTTCRCAPDLSNLDEVLERIATPA